MVQDLLPLASVPLINTPMDHMSFSQLKQEPLPLNLPSGILSPRHYERHQSPHFPHVLLVLPLASAFAGIITSESRASGKAFPGNNKAALGF